MEQQNMMPNGMPGGNMNTNTNMNMGSMMRPQSGNQNQQIHAVIMEHLRANLPTMPPGWQQTFDIRERANRIFQMVSALSLLERNLDKCLNIAETFEQKIVSSSASKEQYFSEWGQKLTEIQRKRQSQAMQTGLGMQNNMGNMHNMNMQQNGMTGMNPAFNGMGTGMNMPNMGMPNQMNMGQQQGGFPQQLQRQMQPSPMPPQQPQNDSINPSALMQMNHMPNQMSQPTPQQRQQQHQQHQQQQMMMNPGQGGGPPNGPSENEVKAHAKVLFESASDEHKKQIRVRAINSMTEQQRQQLAARGVDPVNRVFMQRARNDLIARKQQSAAMGMGVGATGNNMQHSLSQGGQQSNFDFSSIMGQQANAIKSQESGGEVVPASNNNNGSNNGNNQQHMMNFGQNGGGNAQMMQFAAMQEKQRREQMMAQKNQMAQQQALAQQQNQLRGQPGGLNAPNALNGGQVNSPAMNMNMLNRPTFPPGQNTPSTPHQNQMQNHPPQTPSTGANQLQQHHQAMLNQNQNHPLNNLRPDQRQRFIENLPPDARAKLGTLAPAKVNQLLQKLAAQRGGDMGPPGGPNGQGMGMGMGGQPMPNQSAMGVGNATPGFNPQAPNQQQHGFMDPQAGLQQKLQQQQQQAVLRHRAMDTRPFPKQVLSSLGAAVPDTIDSWGKLRQHVAQNQGILPQDSMKKLSAMQKQWFDTHPEELKMAMEDISRMIFTQSNAQRQAQAAQGQQGQQGMQMPGGQAPQAQMVAPPAQMQQPPPNQTQSDIPQEAVNAFRQRMPQAKNMTDDQIRNVMRWKPEQGANQDTQQNLRNAQMNAQMQRAQMMAGNQQTPQQGGPGPQPGQAKAQAQGQGQGQKRGNSDDVVEIPNPNASQPQPQPQSQQNQSQRGPPRMPPGFPSREQLAAMPPEQQNAYKRKLQEMQALRQAQLGINGGQQQGQSVPAKQQNAQQPLQQQQQQQQQPQPQPPPPQQPKGAAPALQQGSQNMNGAQDIMRLKQIYHEVQTSTPKGPQVQLDPRSMQEAQNLLKKLYPIASTLDRTLIAGFRTFGEDRVKEAIKIKHIVMQNLDEHGNIKDYLAVGLDFLKRSEVFIGNYLRELKARQQAQQQQQQQLQSGQNAAKQPQGSGNGQAAGQPQTKQQPQGKSAVPAAPQKEQVQQPALNRKNSAQHARKASQNKAPPAPTENKTFDWASPTPHGVPKYDPGRTELTADKLRFPAQKKRKTTDSQDSTPAAQGTPGAAGASPQVTPGLKRESPEQLRKIPPQPPMEPQKPQFRCSDPFCQASAQGFESEELLKKHMEDEHKPVEDPFQFLIDTVDQGLKGMGVDQNGKPLPKKPELQAATRRPPAAQKVADRKAASGATPALKAESATPATPGSAGKGASTKPGLATPGGKKQPAAEGKAPEEDKTLYDSLIEQMGIELPPPTTKAPHHPTTEETDPWLLSLADALKGPDSTDLSLDDWTTLDFSNLSTFNVPRDVVPASESDSSPELTPASSIGSSFSTVGEGQRLKMIFEWDPSGNGDTAVPERLERMALEEGDAEKDMWDWSGDCVGWQGLFGTESGIGEDDGGFEAVFGGKRGGLGGL